MPQEHPARIIAGISLVVVLIIAGSILYYWNYKTQQEKSAMSHQQYQTAKSLFSSGDYTASIDALSKLVVNNSPDLETLGKSKLYLANSFYARQKGDDVSKSMKIYKEVINNYSIPSYVRALALNRVAGIVRAHDESFYKLYFSDSPWDSYLPSSGTSQSKISEVYKKILELSDEIYPNSYAEYTIAGYYYAPLFESHASLGTTTPAQVAVIMENYIKQADARNDESMYAPNVDVRRYTFRALAISTIGEILKKDNLEERENAFKLILNNGAIYENGNDPSARYEVMRGRFYYADFLLRNFGKKRYSDIETILKPFANASSTSDQAFSATRSTYSTLKKASNTNLVKIKAIALAKISPEFKNFLMSVGWTDKDFK